LLQETTGESRCSSIRRSTQSIGPLVIQIGSLHLINGRNKVASVSRTES
jgi:hypothetical protein